MVDTLGHADVSPAKKDNKAIGELIHQHFPNATLYTTDESIQSISTGCHNITMFISEQLSVATSRKKDLYADLNNIHQKTKQTVDGYRIIPWRVCPAYTGIPRIIQSASKPQERIQKQLPKDKEAINKKGENYAEMMQPYLQRKEGRIVNTTYDTKRQKFGRYLTEALEQGYGTEALTQKRYAGFVEIANHIPVDALLKELNIQFIEKDKEKGIWEISIPETYRSSFLPHLEGTISELKEQLNKEYARLSTDTSALKSQNLLYCYAAIRAATAMVNHLGSEEKIKQSEHEGPSCLR